MILAESEIQRSVDRVRADFPHFADWEHNNELNESYMGFSVWGEYVPEPNEPMSGIFFVTFDTDDANWSGHLTIGKPCYFWSSADVGDAHLLDTKPCKNLEDAITALKQKLADLFAALSGSAAVPGATPQPGDGGE